MDTYENADHDIVIVYCTGQLTKLHQFTAISKRRASNLCVLSPSGGMIRKANVMHARIL